MMRLATIREFDARGGERRIVLVFEHNCIEVEKVLRIGEVTRAELKNEELVRHAKFVVVQAAREAVRDFSYKVHGERWMDFLEDFHGECGTEVEKAMASAAVCFLACECENDA